MLKEPHNLFQTAAYLMLRKLGPCQRYFEMHVLQPFHTFKFTFIFLVVSALTEPSTNSLPTVDLFLMPPLTSHNAKGSSRISRGGGGELVATGSL